MSRSESDLGPDILNRGNDGDSNTNPGIEPTDSGSGGDSSGGDESSPAEILQDPGNEGTSGDGKS